MRILRYAVLLLVFLVGTDMWGQYNPTNPSEPGAAPWKLTLRSIPADAGSFSRDKVTSWAAGTNVSITAYNNGNFVFQRWEYDDGTLASENASFSVIMPSANLILVARYTYQPSNPSEPSVPVNYATINVSASPTDGGSTNPSGANRYQVGSTITLKASNNSNFSFVNWTENGQEISTSSTFSNYEVKEGGANLVANFRYAPGNPGEPAVAVVSHPLYLKANPDGACSFNITSGTSYQEGTTITVQANANTYYTFKNWTMDGEVISSSNRFNFTMPQHAATLIANYSYNYNPSNPSEPGVASTERNHLYGMHEDGIPGQAITYPIYLENTSSLTGFSIDVAFPAGLVVDANNATLTERTSGHTIEVQDLGENAFRFFVRGSDAISGANGKVLEIPLTIPVTEEVGTFYTIGLSKGAVFKADGSQTVVSVRNGSLKIQQSPDDIPDSPDFTISDINVTENETGPGEMIHLSWKVNNIGQLEAASGWSERIYLVSSTGKKVNIGTTYYETTQMEAGTSVSREADIALGRLLGIEGNTYVSIMIVPNAAAGEIAERQANNTTDNKGKTLLVRKQLYLTLPTNTLLEGENTTAMCQLARSGNWTATETFDLSVLAGDSRLQIPATVSIPKDQSSVYFYLTVENNTLLDESTQFTIQASGNGYPAVTGNVEIKDDEKPALTVTSSKSEVTEGESFELTVSIPRVSTSDVPVYIVAEYPKRFTLPSQVTIPAGQTSAQVTVSVVDDEIPSIQLSNAFTVSAEDYTNGEIIVILNDNDIPALELTLTPNRVSESSGVASVAGILRRTGKTDNKITVKLTDNADGRLYFGNRTLELAKGVEEIHFNFGPIDNATVDGDRTYTITAAVWVSSCNCSASGESAGSVIADLEVFDDDGAALSITSSVSTVKEGATTTLTITRNTTTTEALTVTLSSDYDDNLTYNHTITIPVGQTSTTVQVTSTANDVSGDSHTVVFTVAANGFSSGTCYLMVTDQTLPDARIISLTSDKQEAIVNEEALLTLTVTNDGVTELPAGVAVKVYHRGESSAIATLYTKNPIAVGGSETLTKSIVLPAIVGSHRYYAVVNEAHKVNELSYTNNTSDEAVINTTAPFTVTVQTNKSVYQQGEKIIITGQLTGNNTAEADIDLYVINEGARQVQSVKTDAQGAFSYEWELYALQSGHFSVGACYPNEGIKTEMAAFDVYGLKRKNNGNITCEPLVNEVYNGTIELYNPGVLPQTNVHVEIIDKPDHISATFTDISSMVGGSTETIQFSLNSNQLSPISQWEEVKIRIISNEGAAISQILYYHNSTPQAVLATDISQINTTMQLNGSREYLFTVINKGQGDTGEITLGLPSWMKSVKTSSIPSLSYGESTQIALTFVPTDNMQLNVPITGQLSINCKNGDGITLPYSVKPVSDEKGTMVIDVTDEFSYLTDEKPHVKDAHVIIKQPVSNETVAEGSTNADGIFSIELPTGYYTVSVTADKHDSYTNSIMVDPGTETPVDVFLGFQAITYSWNVVETEVEDEYEIKTTVEYETRVPAPVVEVIFPENLTYQSQIINIVATNKGLVSAYNVLVDVPTDIDGATYEVLIPLPIDTLRPQTSAVIPIRMTVNSDQVYESQSAITYGGTYYGDGATDENGSQAGARPKRSATESLSSLCWKTTITLSHDRKVCNPKTHTWEKVGTDYYSRTYTFGNCSGNAMQTGYDWLPSSIPSWIPTYSPKPANPNMQTTITHSNENYNEQISKMFEGCIPKECVYSAAKAAVSCGFAIAGAMSSANPVLSWAFGIGTAAVACVDVVNPTGSNIVDCAISILSTPMAETIGGAAGNAIAGATGEAYGIISGRVIAGMYGTIGCLRSIGDVYKTCTVNNSRTRNGETQSLSISENNHEGIDMVYQADSLTLEKINEVFNNEEWNNVSSVEFGKVQEYLWNYSNDESVVFSPDRYQYKPASISKATFDGFLSRFDNTLKKEKGSPLQTDNYIDIEHVSIIDKQIAKIDSTSKEMGYQKGLKELSDSVVSHYTYLLKLAEETSNSVCASITLQFNQTMTMTRQAFRGTLTVFNGNETTAMTDMKLTLNVSNRTTGQVATAHEFQINAESLNGFTGELDLTSGWSLAANGTGTATILFIPTKYAAPSEPTEWAFGGTLSYVDPFTGLEVTRELYPVTLTVKPSPELDLTYFMQRDIYGDDPLTLDVVEPMIPAEFALLINNKGNGDATNVRMLTQQPEIIDNEKGLHIDFEIISSQVNGGEANLAFGKSIANDFGTIPAHSQSYAQWWLTSTLLGHFTEYDVQANHVTSYGNEDLSLLGDVTIHEMIRSLDLSTNGNKMVGFLVNDITDSEDLPDMLYLSNGETASVSIASNCQMSKTSVTTYHLTITPSLAGWTYGNILDPTNGMAELKSIVRQRDGKEINLRNFWQTDRTLRDGKDPLYEYRIHFADEFISTSPETYILTFDPVPEVVLSVESIDGVPEEGTIAEEPVNQVTVKFNKKIAPETFTSDDITFAVQGTKQETSLIGISTEDNENFSLDLTTLTEQCPNGYYTMTVQTADITDIEGYHGQAGKQVGWILFRGGLVQLITSAWPENSGTVIRRQPDASTARKKEPEEGSENTAKYGSTVVLEANASNGYEFVNWTLNGEVVSTEPEFEALAISDLNIVANFTKKTYQVDIESENEGGTVSGTATGIYEYETPVHLTAVPGEDFVFKHWTVNGQVVTTDDGTLTINLDKNLDIKPVFLREYYRQTITFSKGWNWLSSYLNESIAVNELPNYINRIVGQTDELIKDPQYGLVGNISELAAGKAYKIEAARVFNNTFRGHRYDASASPITLHQGWNWIAYPYSEQALLNNVISNASEGDYITSQSGFAEYADGNWAGTLDTFAPGNGYLYKSTTEKDLTFDFSTVASLSRSRNNSTVTNTYADESMVDIHRYPNTMNMTVQLFRDGTQLDADEYNIYAMSEGEIRGVSRPVDGKHYLTVYGSASTDVSFVVESSLTGESFEAQEVLKFRDDVVGSRRSPFAINIGDASGIDVINNDGRPMTVYSLQGNLISRDATMKMLQRLPKGVYIVNGQKCFIK